jgi:hypothetical protein
MILGIAANMQRRGFSNIYQQILARKLASGF